MSYAGRRAYPVVGRRLQQLRSSPRTHQQLPGKCDGMGASFDADTVMYEDIVLQGDVNGCSFKNGVLYNIYMYIIKFIPTIRRPGSILSVKSNQNVESKTENGAFKIAVLLQEISYFEP